MGERRIWTRLSLFPQPSQMPAHRLPVSVQGVCNISKIFLLFLLHTYIAKLCHTFVQQWSYLGVNTWGGYKVALAGRKWRWIRLWFSSLGFRGNQSPWILPSLSQKKKKDKMNLVLWTFQNLQALPSVCTWSPASQSGYSQSIESEV